MTVEISQESYDLLKRERGVTADPHKDPLAFLAMKDVLAGVSLGLIIVPINLKW